VDATASPTSRSASRRDRLPDLAQRLELGDLAGQLAAALRESAHQLDLAQHDRALDGELLQQGPLVGVERRDVCAPHLEHPDDLVVDDHRCRQERAVAAAALEVLATVVRVAEDVGDLLSTPVQHHPTELGGAVDRHRVFAHVPLEVLGDLP
jgi:hypothetical protein